MLFSSTEFLFAFLPLTLILYYLFSFSRHLKNIILLAASLYFYAWGEPRFVYVMLASIVCNYIAGLGIGTARTNGHPRTAKLMLTLGILCNLGLLFVFKYLTFVLGNINARLQTIPTTSAAFSAALFDLVFAQPMPSPTR